MKIKLNSLNKDFLNNLNDFMSRTNQNISDSILEFLGFLNTPYKNLKVKNYFFKFFKAHFKSRK